MAPLPLFKLGALLAKQISKPLARIIKEKSLTNNFLKTKLVIPCAQGKQNLIVNSIKFLNFCICFGIFSLS